jgi:DNA-directed RNA polymerase sigma subunit (sigma70/sigma32)
LGFDVAASWEDIAQELGVTRQRVQQIYESILRKLRKRHGAELRSVLEAMRGDS